MAPPGPGWRSNAASVFWQTCWRPASEAHPRLAYSLAISTVNNISWYAAGGIGSTAVRFSGRYSRDSAGYRTLALGRPLCGRHDPARMLPRLSRRSAPAAGDSAALGSDWSRHDRAPACRLAPGPGPDSRSEPLLFVLCFTGLSASRRGRAPRSPNRSVRCCGRCGYSVWSSSSAWSESMPPDGGSRPSVPAPIRRSCRSDFSPFHISCATWQAYSRAF